MKKRFYRAMSAVLVVCGLLPVLAIPTFAETAPAVHVDWNQEYQVIDGFGFTQEEECTYSMEEPYRTEVLDLLFDQEKGIGCSILRAEIGCGESKPTIEPELGVWDRTGDAREIWYFNEALARGVDKIYGTVWSPPAWMKTHNNVNHGGWLKGKYYQEYATYLAENVKNYRDNFGIELYGISPANEPEFPAKWKSCLWSGRQMKDFVQNYLYPTFQQEGLSTKIMVGESGFWSDAVVKPLLNDDATAHMVDVVTSHQYQGRIKDLPLARQKGKHLWQSELCDTVGNYHVEIDDAVGWGKIIHEFMTIPQANAFLYWRGAHETNTNQTMIRIDSPTSYTVPKRLYALGHYSKFVRPDWVRMEAADEPYPELYISAYKDPVSGKFAIVLVNNDRVNGHTVDFHLQNFTADAVVPYVTDAWNDLAAQDAIPVVNQTFTLTIGAESMVTLTGVNQ